MSLSLLHNHYITWLRGVACWTCNFIMRECPLLCVSCCIIGKAWIKKNKPPANIALLLQLYSLSHKNKRHLSTRFIPLALIYKMSFCKMFQCCHAIHHHPRTFLFCLIPPSATSSTCSVFSWAAWELGHFVPLCTLFPGGKVQESISCFISKCSNKEELHTSCSPFTCLSILLK